MVRVYCQGIMKSDQTKPETRSSPGSGKWLLGGGLAAAFAVSLCCLGPLAFAALGLGTFAAAGFFHEMRPLFLGLAILFVAGAWIWDWRQRKLASCKNVETGCNTRSRLVLTVFTALALLLGASPYILRGGAEQTGGARLSTAMTTADSEVTSLAVWEGGLEGLYCPTCTTGLKRAFEEVDGVKTAKVTCRPQRAFVQYDSERVKSERFQEVVEDFGYSVVTAK